jgi:hypothetical protein
VQESELGAGRRSRPKVDHPKEAGQRQRAGHHGRGAAVQVDRFRVVFGKLK